MSFMTRMFRTSVATVLIAAFAHDASAQVGGSGTVNYIPKWTGTTTLGNSQLWTTMHMGFATATPNFAGYGGDSRVFTINSPGTFGLGVVELATDRVPSNGMEIGDVATSLLNNNVGSRRISRVLTLAAGSTSANRGGHLTFHTKQNGVSGFPVERMRITDAGNVGIGTTNPGSFKLAVEGKIGAREVQVTLTNPFPDYVFESEYRLLPLEALESHVRSQKHLPGIPTAAEVSRDGINVGAFQAQLLEKVEELTLYVIELNKSNDALEARLAALER